MVGGRPGHRIMCGRPPLRSAGAVPCGGLPVHVRLTAIGRRSAALCNNMSYAGKNGAVCTEKKLREQRQLVYKNL